MNYWIICLPKADLQHCIDNGIFGLARKLIINGVREGDKIVCCAGKGDWKIIALGEATSDYYVDDEQVFLKQGYFLDRFNFDARYLKEERDLMPLLSDLSFVTNLVYWAVYFRNGIVKMSNDDWKLITSII